MGKCNKCRTILNSKVINPVIEINISFGNNENSFKIIIEKINHAYLTKQSMYSSKSKLDTTMHSYIP